MGYTHHWVAPLAHPHYAAAWPGIGPDGYRRPIIDEAEGVAFNGDATSDLDYETYALNPPTIAPRQDDAFCKTGRNPYDMAVTAVLLRCHLLLPDLFGIRSDGDWEREWLCGARPPAPDTSRPRSSARMLVGELFGPVPPASPFRTTGREV